MEKFMAGLVEDVQEVSYLKKHYYRSEIISPDMYPSLMIKVSVLFLTPKLTT